MAEEVDDWKPYKAKSKKWRENYNNIFRKKKSKKRKFRKKDVNLEALNIGIHSKQFAVWGPS